MEKLRFRQLLLTTALSAAVLATGLVAGPTQEAGAAGEAAPPEPYYAPGEMPRYPGALEFPLGYGLQLNGYPLRISYFQSKDPPEVVRDWYLAHWRAAKLDPDVREEKLGYTVIAYDGKASAQKMALIQKYGKGSLVFPSVVPVDAGAQIENVFDDPDVPYTSQAFGVMHINSQGAGGGKVVTWQERGRAADAEQAMRGQMQSRGWELQHVEGTRGLYADLNLSFKKGAKYARAVISPYRYMESGCSVTVNVTEGD